MTLDERKEALKQELCTKIDQDIKDQGQQISTDDVDTLLVKKANDTNDLEVEFGLKITERKDQKLYVTPPPILSDDLGLRTLDLDYNDLFLQ